MFTPDQIKQINEIIKQAFVDNYYAGAPKIPPHSHNGIDNIPVDAVLSLTAGSGITITPVDTIKGNLTISLSGGSGTPGAPVNSVQFNNPLGTFDGNASFTFVVSDLVFSEPTLELDDSSGGGSGVDSGGARITGGSSNINVVTDANGGPQVGSVNLFAGDNTGDTGFLNAGWVNLKAGSAQISSTEVAGGSVTITAGVTFTADLNGGGITLTSGRCDADTFPGVAGDIILLTDGDPFNTVSRGGAIRTSPNIVLVPNSSGYLDLSPTDLVDSDLKGGVVIKNGIPPNGVYDGLGYGTIYVEGGALKYRGDSGTVTTIAPA